MQVRSEQLQTLAATSATSFEADMVLHLRKMSPGIHRVVGDEVFRTAIANAIKRTGSYGFTNRGPIRLYLELQILLGHNFDTDPQYTPAAAILRKGDFTDQMPRAERLFEWSRDTWGIVAGPDYQHARDALSSLRDRDFEKFRLPPGDPVNPLAQLLAGIHPQKAKRVSGAAIEAIAAKGVHAAARAQVTSDPGIALVCGLMFALGHGILTDPYYPWIHGTLFNTSVATANECAALLYRKAVIYFDQAAKDWNRHV